MEKKQTAVEWLAERCGLQALEDVIAEAKQMEKERLKDAFIEGANTIYAIPKTFDEWYHETYGGQDEK
jgi:precorrin-6B methylase 2